MFSLAALGAGIGSLLTSALPTTISTLGSMRNTDKTNQANKDIAADTNATNYQVAQENLAFQRENLDYQKALQQQIFEREDTSYQRTVDDMRAAGLSPLSMQSTNGAGEVIPTEAMNNSFQAQGYTAQAADLSALNQLGTVLQGYAGQRLQRDQLRLQSQYQEAQIAKLNSETDYQNIQNTYQSALLEKQLEKLGLENSGISLDNQGKGYDNTKRQNDIKKQLIDLKFAPLERRFGIMNLMEDTTAKAMNNRNLDREYRFKYENNIFDSMSDKQRDASFILRAIEGDSGERTGLDPDSSPSNGYVDDDGNFHSVNSRAVGSSKGFMNRAARMAAAMMVGENLREIFGDFNINKLLPKKGNTNKGNINNRRH